MFRLLLSLIYLALTAVGAIVVWLGVDSAAEPLEAQLEQGVQSSFHGYEATQRLRDLQLRDVAAGLAGSEVSAYLGVLSESRNAMLTVEAQVYEQFPGEPDDPSAHASRKAWVLEQTEYLDGLVDGVLARLDKTADAAFWTAHPKDKLRGELRDKLADCSATAVSSCFFQLTYFPLKEHVDRANAAGTYDLKPDLVVVTDDRGTGVADVNQPKWSDDTRFSERYALVRKVREGVIVRDVIQIEGSNSYYFVAAAPVMGAGGEFRGAVLVGTEIDDGLLTDEGKMLGYQVSYFDGQKLIRSALAEPLRKELSNNLPPRSEDARRFFLKTDSMVAQFVPLAGNHSNRDIQVAISAMRAEISGPVSMVKAYIWLYAALMFLVGMGLFMWVIRTYTKPLVEIDSGIHEIMNGNHNYEFESDYNDQLWAAMAQSLNRMVGILLGRNLEEDELDEYMGVQGRRSEDEPES